MSTASESGSASSDVIPLTVIILTRDEAENIGRCLASVCGWTRAVYVVDSGSTDNTVEIARQFGANVLAHPFSSHSSQWRWALQHIPIETAWVLGLDADQAVSPELRTWLRDALGAEGNLEGVDGVYVNRRQIFRGTWIRHGGYYPKYLLKLFRPAAVIIDERDLVDHHFFVHGRSVRAAGDLIEENRKEDDIAFWIDKHNRYARRLAQEEVERRRSSQPFAIRPRLLGSPDERTAFLRGIWFMLPLYVRSIAYFFFRFLIQRGFLDGKQGMLFHFMHALWYRLLIDMHVDSMLPSEKESGRDAGGAP